MVERMHRLPVLSMVVVVSVVEWSPGLAVHEEHEGPLHDVGCLHPGGHGPRGGELLSNFFSHLFQQNTGVRRGDTF